MASFNEILHTRSLGVKRKLSNESSSSLWHKQLGHISRKKIQRLVSGGVFDSLDFTDFDVCVNCIKGKLTNIRKLSSN